MEPPIADPTAQTWWIWADEQCTPAVQDSERLHFCIMPTELEATGKDCGVPVAKLQGKSWAPPPTIDYPVNVGTRLKLSLIQIISTKGQARCQLKTSSWGGASVLVRGRESRPHGEGRQQVRSCRTGISGGHR